MLERVAIKLAIKLLKMTTLSVESRNLLTSQVLETLGAVPIRDTISISTSGEILVNGVPPDYDVFLKLREGAQLALENTAMQLVWNQVRYTSLVGSATQGSTPTDIYFYRVAIWIGEQERNWLRILAGIAE